MLLTSRSVPLLVATALLVGVPVAAQQPREVRGTVHAVGDGSPLAGVRVRVPALNQLAITDDGGAFRLAGVPRAPVVLEFVRIGVVRDTLVLAPERDTITVFLRLSAVPLDPLVAEGVLEARARFEQTAQPSIVSVDQETIARIPAVMESDVIRVVQLLPGTIALNDYTVGFNVRGGEPDQNLTQLDGVTIFNPSHLGGLFSTFDADAVERIEFLTGAFPAEYGGRLSSVLDVGLRPGRTDRIGASGQVSLLASKLLVEGPIGSTGATLLVSGRRTYADVLVAALSNQTLPYYFADAVSRLTVPVGDGVLGVSGYWGRDALDWTLIEERAGQDPLVLGVNWGNALAGARFDHPVGPHRLTLDAGVTTFATHFGLEPDLFAGENTVRLLSLRGKLALAELGGHEIRTGASVEAFRMLYDLGSETFETSFFTARFAPRVWAAFVDDQWRARPWLLIRPGLRLEAVEGPGAINVAPRVGVKAFLTRDLALTGSAGRYHQAIHSLRDQNLPWTIFDTWIGADSATPVGRSDHLVLGVEGWLDRGTSFSVEGYRKTFANIVDANFNEDPRVPGDETVPVAGDAWGVDVLLRKHAGRVTGWAAYSLTKVTRWSNGVEYAAVHDRRHTLNVVLQMRGPFGSEFGVRWGYGSPLPYTPFLGEWDHRFYRVSTHSLADYEREPIASPLLNSARYPAYSRIDLSFRWEQRAFGGILRPYVQLVNLTNRGNVFLYFFDYSSTPAIRRAIPQLPLLPSLGLEFEF